MKVPCHFCGVEVPAEYAWQGVKGWEHRRKGGGTNALALRRTVDVYCCDDCMRKKKRGISLKQEELQL